MARTPITPFRFGPLRRAQIQAIADYLSKSEQSASYSQAVGYALDTAIEKHGLTRQVEKILKKMAESA